jgi:hypothetical protein
MNARESENYLAISRSSSASKSVEMFWAEIYRGRLFLGPNLVSVSFNRNVVPYEISKVNFLSVCQKRFNKLKNINISKTS